MNNITTIETLRQHDVDRFIVEIENAQTTDQINGVMARVCQIRDQFTGPQIEQIVGALEVKSAAMQAEAKELQQVRDSRSEGQS